MAGPTLRAGSEIMIGAPRSVHPDFVRALGQAVAGIPQVLEAHLPVCFIKGESESALPVLVVVLASEKDAQAVMERLGRTLERVVPRGAAFDVWPLTAGHELLAPVRKAGCRLGNGDLERPHSTRRKWWQFWQ